MKRRGIKLLADTHYQALQAARQRDKQTSWPLLYNQRAGIEGTLSQGFAALACRTGGPAVRATLVYRKRIYKMSLLPRR